MFGKGKRSIKKAVDECHSKAVSADLSAAQRAVSGGFNLLSTIRASRVVIKTEIGAVEIGLTGFELSFKFENGTVDRTSFPSEIDPELPTKIPVTLENSKTYERTTKQTTGKSGAANLSNAPSVSISRVGGREQSNMIGNSKKDVVQFNRTAISVCHATNEGFSLYIENPFDPREPINQKIYDSRLCWVAPVNNLRAVAIRPTVQVAPRQVWRGEGTGAFSPANHANKERIKNRLVAKLVEEDWSLTNLEITSEADSK